MELQNLQTSRTDPTKLMLSEDAAKSNRKLTSWALGSAILAIFSGFFQYGYSIGCVNAAAEVIQKSIQQYQLERYNTTFTPNQLNHVWVSLVASFPIGGLFGCVLVNTCVQKLGLLRTMIWMHCLTILMSVFMMMSDVLKSFEVIIVARFFIGVSTACAGIGISPAYAVEVLPTSWRGMIGSCIAFSINLGIFLCNLLGLPEVLGSENLWPLTFGLVCIPSIVFISLCYFMPKGPRTLYIIERKQKEAEQLLKKLRNSEDVSEEISEMHNELLALQSSDKLSVPELIRSPLFRPQLVCTIVLTVAYQTTGLNGIAAYMNRLVATTGVDKHVAHYTATFMAGTLTLVALFGGFAVKKCGRRTLLIGGYIAEATCLTLLTVTIRYQYLATWLHYVAIVCCFGYLVSFVLAPGGVTLLFIAEIFTQTARESAVIVAGFILWAGFALVVIVFPYVQDALGPYAYLLFAAIALSTAVFLFFTIPETKGRSFLEIEASFPRNLCCYSHPLSNPAKENNEQLCA